MWWTAPVVSAVNTWPTNRILNETGWSFFRATKHKATGQVQHPKAVRARVEAGQLLGKLAGTFLAPALVTPDASPGAQPHIHPDDTLICFGSPITRYRYTQRVDYFVKRNAKLRALKYMSNGIPTLERLHEALRKESENRVWIFGDDCASLLNWHTFEMCQFLEKLKPNAICTDLGQ